MWVHSVHPVMQGTASPTLSRNSTRTLVRKAEAECLEGLTQWTGVRNSVGWVTGNSQDDLPL